MEEYDSLISHLGPPELLPGPLKQSVVPLSFPSYINRMSMIITVSKTLWKLTKFFIRATSRTLNSFLDPLNLLKRLPSVIY